MCCSAPPLTHSVTLFLFRKSNRCCIFNFDDPVIIQQPRVLQRSRMSVLHRKSACVVSVETNLLELTRRAQLESLRYHCALYACFPPHKDPLIAPVSAEELKKLARAWKLHERRNFWKLHTTRDQLVEALLEYARDNKIDLTLVLHKDQQIDPKSPKKFPDSPKSPKPSSFQGSPKRASISLSPGISTHSIIHRVYSCHLSWAYLFRTIYQI